ncbi:urea hydro-lyase cyanamide [Moniliophthora roreri MCA 2997]|uniref:Urea hydro-lyase cyanamide n=2 Tax=Moniliophthora roreri TaxID=221103 RepID=V2XKA8_MONRO|nr:urea hydro-lyase cyanamide [Moniliophthora roreri MCA 2997]KAI3604145.1 urea hydro-lyase cyanamide [Moniliophthora roreri]
MSVDPNISFYGFTPVARDPDILFADHPTASGENPKQDPFTVDDFPLPDSPLVRDVKAFVKKELDEQTFNHSNRVYIYGVALTKTHFPSWSYDPETYYLACLLHDIGTAKKYLATTKMSFEFKGAIVARELILSLGGVEDQADSVCDAIVRHQDIFVKGGNITMIGQILQLSTILDNVGGRANLIHPRLIETTTTAFPRKGWSEHFARVIEKEEALKPWCHTTTFEVPNWKVGIPSKFATDVRNNAIMKPFD